MQTDQHMGDKTPRDDAAGTSLPVPNTENGQERRRTPAKLPTYSQAAAAQRLNDVPERPVRGIYYSAPHTRTHPIGWRTKRYMKRKNLRISNQRFAAVDRLGTRTLLQMAISAFSIFLVGLVIFVTVSGFINATQQKYGTKVTTLEDILPRDNLKMYDAKGNMIYQRADEGLQTSVPLSQVSPHMLHAEIAVEDQYFWNNPGYDITGIVRAAVDDLLHGHVVSGGSTITQQLVKNAIVGNQSTVLRKLQELTLAPSVTRYYSKEKILEMYLNTTYYGQNVYGVEAAAFRYFGLQATPNKSAASQLTIAQSAMLAGIPSAPTQRNPFLYPKSAVARVQDVLQLMYSQGYITAREKAIAMDEVQRPGFLKLGTIKNRIAPHFANYTMRELAKELHVKATDLPRSGLYVATTLDLDLQNKVLKIAQKHIAEMRNAHHMSNAAVIVLDYRTGAIKTLVGNINPDDPRTGDFDVASQGFRQPGSSFKPYIYATAFEQGVSPGETVYDGPLTIQMCCGLPSYSPLNYDLKWHGNVTYRYALQNSFNIPAVKLLMRTGVDSALKTAQNLGITAYQGVPNYTMVLGSLSVHPLDNTAAFGSMANGGVRVPPHAITTVKDQTGKVILNMEKPKGVRVMSKETAFMMTDVLSDNNSRIFEFGKCSSLLLYTNTMNECYGGKPGVIRPSAAKTGTSNDFRDNWTVGYTTDIAVGVWAGNNDNSPMVDVTGVDGAGPIWHDTMLLASQGKPIRNFPGAPSSLLKKDFGGGRTDWVRK